MKHGYLIDMDGVLYRGTEVITGADTFIQQLRAREIPFRLLTNNSQRTRRDVVAKLNRMGIDVDEEQIFTSAMATARFLAQQKPGGTAFVIGEGGLLTALHQNGYAVVDHEPACDEALQSTVDGALGEAKPPRDLADAERGLVSGEGEEDARRALRSMRLRIRPSSR